jgi:hypothetical protein
MIGGVAGWTAYFAGLNNSTPLLVAGVSGIIALPSLGHFYAGETRRGLLHATWRAGAAMTFGAGVLLLDYCYGRGDCSDAGLVAGMSLMSTGFGIGIGSTIWSIIDAPRAARRVNEKGHSSAIVVPTALMGPGRRVGYGLSVLATF